MKKIALLAGLSLAILISNNSNAQQDKSKRASTPAKVSQKISSGASISIDYSQPALKGRTIGKDVEPMMGKVWRMGANEATVFETDRDVLVEGKPLPAGKYSLFGLWGDDGYTLIFNKAWNIWGTAYDQNKDKDVLRVKVSPLVTTTAPVERLVYTIDPSGETQMRWGNLVINFYVK